MSREELQALGKRLREARDRSRRMAVLLLVTASRMRSGSRRSSIHLSFAIPNRTIGGSPALSFFPEAVHTQLSGPQLSDDDTGEPLSGTSSTATIGCR